MKKQTGLQAHLAALLQANQAVASSLDLEATLQRIVRQAADISEAHGIRLFFLDEESQVLRFRVGWGPQLEAERDMVIPVGVSFSGEVAATGEPLAIADCRGDTRLRYPEHAAKYGLVSYLGLPVKFQDRLFGVLVFNTSAPRVYSDDQIAFLGAFAQQAAVAIQNARLFQQGQERLGLLEAVRAVSEEVTRELHLPTLLGLVIQRAVELVGVVSGVVWLWDEGQQALVPGSWHGRGDWMKGRTQRLGEGVVGTVAQRREGMIVNGLRASPLSLPVFAQHSHATAILAEPLLYGDRLLGVISIDNAGIARSFGQRDREVLGLLGSQAAIAIQNAQLLAALRQQMDQITQQHRRAEALLDISRAVSSTLEPGRVLDFIVEKAQVVTGADACGLVQLGSSGLLEYGPSRGFTLQGPQTLAGGLLPDEGLMGRCLSTGRPAWSPNVLQDPDLTYRAETRARLEAEGMRAGLAVPIVPFSGPYAVLFVGRRVVHDYSPTEVGFLEAMAAHAAVALENARLYDEMRRQRDEVNRLRGELVQAEKMGAIGVLAAGVAHEVNNPLGFVSSNLETLDRYVAALTTFAARASADGGGTPPAEMARLRRELDLDYILQDLGPLLSDTRDGVDRVARIVRDLNHFSRGDTAESAEANPVECLETAVSLAWNEIKHKAELVRELEPIPPVMGYAQQITQVFLNLLLNAAQAIPDRGIITLRTGQAGEEMWIEVADTGCGIPAEHLPRIFDPFFTTKPVGQGTGLGLAVSYGIVERHGGRIEVRSREGQGAVFRVVLPPAGNGGPPNE